MATSDHGPSFDVTTTAAVDDGASLVVGQANPGLAGLTCVDHLVRHLDARQVGHVTARNTPDVTPFEDGVPRHPIRLYDVADHDLVLLASEVFVPVWATDPFVDAVLEWATASGVGEVAKLYGVPYPHAETEHRVFYVATEAYRAAHFEDDLTGMGGGFLDGCAGEFVSRGLEEGGLPTGVYVTPTHPPGPDLDAALELLAALEAEYGFEVDETELRERSEEQKRYFAQLASRMDEFGGEASRSGQDYPEDRMYM